MIGMLGAAEPIVSIYLHSLSSRGLLGLLSRNNKIEKAEVS